MTSPLRSLAPLIARLESAEEGSRAFDCEIAAALEIEPPGFSRSHFLPEVSFRFAVDKDTRVAIFAEVPNDDREECYRVAKLYVPPAFSTSIDAALTLYKQKPDRVPVRALDACVEALRQW